jgi:tetratricopeptide (TPR) repeat protein
MINCKINLINKITCLAVWGIIFTGNLAHADTPPTPQIQKNLTTYAAEDFQAYKKSSYTGASYDPFVQEGFQALDKQDLTTAIEFLRKATNLGCQSPVVYFKLALAYEGTGSYYSAVQYYELARDQFSKDKIEHRYRKQLDENYGRALYLLGKKDEAMPILVNSLKNGDNPWALRIVAAYYLEKGDLASASTCYDRYVHASGSDLTPADQLEIYLLLARSYRNLNDTESAKKYYQQIASIDAANKEAADYLKQQEPKPSSSKAASMDQVLDMFKH